MEAKIKKEEILELLQDINSTKIICREYCFKPSEIAKLISSLLTHITDYGYIIIGACKDGSRYKINGIAKDFQFKNIVGKSRQYLTGDIIYDVGDCLIENKNVFVIKIIQNKPKFKLSFKDNIEENECAFITELYRACALLQSNKKYIDASEDERNDYIRDIMSTAGYDVKDQTRQGASPTNKNAGEVDLMFVKNRLSFAIVEALNLKSLDKAYLKSHIDKIYNYDKRGHKFNVVLSYVEAKDFGSFWQKYCDHAKYYKYTYDKIGENVIADINEPYTEIRYMTTTLNRSNKEIRLYHLCVHVV